MPSDKSTKNTYKEIWRGPDEGKGDFYADKLFITENGSLGMDCGGYVIVKPIREWFKSATLLPPLVSLHSGVPTTGDVELLRDAIHKLMREVHELNPGIIFDKVILSHEVT